MHRGLPLDAIDSKLVLRVYAALVGPVGLFMCARGERWLGGSPNDQTWTVDALTRMAGALIVAAALSAYAASTIANPVDRRRMLGWFAATHTFLAIAALSQTSAVWDIALPASAKWLYYGLLAAMSGLIFGFVRHGGDIAPLGVYMGLFGTPPPAASTLLRAQYEEDIREAGAQQERNRLARDLHDSIKQQIFAIQTSAATVEARLPTDPAGARVALTQVRDAARESMVEMDAMLDQLRVAAIDNAGLVEALKRQSEALEFRTGTKVRFSAGRLPASDALPPGAQQALLRIGQEALSNVARHARASHVTVELATVADRLTLRIADNGQGYDDGGARGMGLDNMRARASAVGGDVRIVSSAGQGTEVAASVPFAIDDPRAFLWRAACGTAAAAIVAGLATARDNTGLMFCAAPMVFDAVRYLIAWRRATELRRVAT